MFSVWKCFDYNGANIVKFNYTKKALSASTKTAFYILKEKL